MARANFWLTNTALPPWICMADGDPEPGADASGGGSGGRAGGEPATAATDDAAGADGASGGDSATESVEPKPAAQLPVWVQKEMSRQQRERAEAERALAERERRLTEITAENERLRQLAEAAARGIAPTSQQTTQPQGVSGGAQPSQISPSDFRSSEDYKRAVREEAERISGEERRVSQLQKIEEDGQKAYGANWQSVINNLTALGGFQRPEDVAVIMASDNPAKVFHQLAQLESDGQPAYLRIMGIRDDFKRFNELAKLGSNMTSTPPARPQSSNAPAPIEPISTRGAHGGGPIDLYNDKVADQDWYAVRVRQKQEAWDRKHGMGRR